MSKHQQIIPLSGSASARSGGGGSRIEDTEDLRTGVRRTEPLAGRRLKGGLNRCVDCTHLERGLEYCLQKKFDFEMTNLLDDEQAFEMMWKECNNYAARYRGTRREKNEKQYAKGRSRLDSRVVRTHEGGPDRESVRAPPEPKPAPK